MADMLYAGRNTTEPGPGKWASQPDLAAMEIEGMKDVLTQTRKRYPRQTARTEVGRSPAVRPSEAKKRCLEVTE
jgi:hypothetical protein